MPFVIIGLGNPGNLYAGTRHNVGFEVIHSLAHTLSIPLKKPIFHSYLRGMGRYQDKTIILAKPLTYMNRSGTVLGSILHYADASLDEIIIVCDSLDLEPGVCRLKTRGSSAGQKGLASILHYAGTNEIMRLFIGIGRSPDQSVVDYVLSRPCGEEAEKLTRGINRAASALLQLTGQSPREVMNVLNRRTIEA